MQKPISLLLLTLIDLINGNSFYTNCRPYENKIYQVTVTFPDKRPLYAALRLLPSGTFDELFSIANGHNEEEVGANFALSNRIGYYRCLPGERMRLTGLGYLYRTEDVPFLKTNGALVIHDYNFKFFDNGKRCTGLVKYAVFENGQNPFTTTDNPLFQGPLGKVTCQLLKFRTYYSLENESS